MPEITILMPVKNTEYIKETTDNIFRQSFTDFELLIINNDKDTVSYSYSNICCVHTLNEGIAQAKGNYIAIINAGDKMHTEKLRIQIKRMKLNPEITVCATWVKPFQTSGAYIHPINAKEYFIDSPILQLFTGNFIINTSVMINRRFLIDNNLVFEDYPYVEDYKLWFEIAKHGGFFYMEPQYLTFFRIEEINTEIKKNEIQEQTIRIQNEILCYLLENVKSTDLVDLYLNMQNREKEGLILYNEIFHLFYNIFKRKRVKI
jgi:glycosyltransferase involved in cell wall biosynthesis